MSDAPSPRPSPSRGEGAGPEAVDTLSAFEGEGGAQRRVRGYSERTQSRAKQLRREMTYAERKLWSMLRGRHLNGTKFRRQQPIGPYVADFVCQEHRLVIEADGGQHAENANDERRTAFLESKAYRVIRFWNHEILTNLEGVAQVIATALSTPHPAQASPESPSPSRGEGTGAINA